MIYAALFEDDSDDEDEEKKNKEIKVTSSYTGEFVKGKRTEGTLTYENGDVFTGEFTAEGLRDSGSMKFMNGDEFAGIFQ